MITSFTTWVTKDTLRWHLRFFAPQFTKCLETTPAKLMETTYISIACFDMTEDAMAAIRDAWKSSLMQVVFVPLSNEGVRRHNAMYRPWNRIAGLKYLRNQKIHPDYIISINPTTSFRGDAVKDYLDSAAQMERWPWIGAIIHSRTGSSRSNRNDIVEANQWGARINEGVTFRNLEKVCPTKYNYMIHKSVPAMEKMYLEDTAILHGVQFEGYGLAMRNYHDALTYDPVYFKLSPRHLTNPFGRMRGDNWDCSLNNGWPGSMDKEFFANFVDVGIWQQNRSYIWSRPFKPDFLARFYEKNNALKKSVAETENA